MESATTTRQAAVAATAPREDLYAGIHKALRLFMSDTLVRVGSTDPADDGAVAGTLGQVEALLAGCQAHLAKENGYVHPLLEAAAPGSAARVAAEHAEHEEAIASLRDLAAWVRHAAQAQRAAALHRLYGALAGFVAHNLEHMQLEETEHNAVLWAHYSDIELRAAHDRLVASIPPQEMMALIGWFMPALSAPERAGMLAGIRAGAPAPVFDAVLDVARSRLPAAEMRKLAATLGVAA
jgi:hypothetical protein